jgi:hypothetical protein
MVSFPQTAYSNSVGTVVGEVCSSLSPAGTHCLAPQLSVSDHREDVYIGLRRDCFQVVVLLRSSRSDGLHGIQVVVHMQLRRADGAYRQRVTQIKSLSLFQIKNNQISRDIKGLFLGHRFVWSLSHCQGAHAAARGRAARKRVVSCQGSNGPGGP